MGSLANMLMRTLLNVTVKVNNLVVKYAMPAVMATLTCDSLQVKTEDDLHLGGLQVNHMIMLQQNLDCDADASVLHTTNNILLDLEEVCWLALSRTQETG